ncbi:hypothetical protein BH23ACT6_BH23ACT6_20160 [soil metagenome]
MGPPMQLHPGDVGWFWRFGAETTAAAVRTWRLAGKILAVGLQDQPHLLRLAIASDAQQDTELAQRLATDVTDRQRGVLAEPKASVEAPAGAMVHDLLFEGGWSVDEPWTPLRCDLSELPKAPSVRIETTGPEEAHTRVAVQRASFDSLTFTGERWESMGVHRDHRGHGYGAAIDSSAKTPEPSR